MGDKFMDDNEYFESLIIKHLDKEATASEQAELQIWMDTDPLHRQEYLALEKIWKDSAPALQQQFFDKVAAWEKMQPAMHLPMHPPIQPATRPLGKSIPPVVVVPWLRIKYRVAAASVLLIALSSGWWFFSKRDKQDFSVIHAENADQQVRLPDGSQAWLRRGATLHYSPAFNKKGRQVEMTGEIFFEVIHDAGLPFSVKTPHALIEDIGTSFLVKGRESFDEVIVATGKVRITDMRQTSNTLVLAEGEKALLKEDRFIRSAAKGPNVFAWKTGKLDFRDTPLDLALEEIGDYYRVVVIIPEALKAEARLIRLTARFEKQPITEALEEIKLTTGSGIRLNKDTLFLHHR
ncbi:FecR family protein [Flavitalea flava]